MSQRLSYVLTSVFLVMAMAAWAWTGPLGGASDVSEAAGVDAAHPYEFVTGSFEAKKDAGISFLISNPNSSSASVTLQLFTSTTQVGSNFTVNIQGRNTLTAILFATSTGLHFARLSSSLDNVTIQYRHMDAASVTHFVDAGHVRAIQPKVTGLFTEVAPFRLCDTRPGRGTACQDKPLTAGETFPVTVAGVGGLPATGIRAVVVNVTAVKPTTPGYLTMFPTGSTRPISSTINFAAGAVIANGTTVKLGNGGQISAYNPAGTVDMVIDVLGYYT